MVAKCEENVDVQVGFKSLHSEGDILNVFRGICIGPVLTSQVKLVVKAEAEGGLTVNYVPDDLHVVVGLNEAYTGIDIA